MDRYYDVARVQFRDRTDDLEHRHATGLTDEASYNREKLGLERAITNRAATLAWTSHELRKKQLEAQGIPTPDHPQDILVPQAGSLPTGSEFHRFNQNELGGSTSNSTINDMRQMVGDYHPGENVRPSGNGGR